MQLVPKGVDAAAVTARFPELSLLAENICDVDILSAQPVNAGRGSERVSGLASERASVLGSERVPGPQRMPERMPGPQRGPTKAQATQPPPGPPPSSQPSSFSSSPSALKRTFPAGHALSQVPAGDFDFHAALNRFDKARVFADIRQQDLVRPEDLLVNINAPQRKLGVRESVLDAREPAQAQQEKQQEQQEKQREQQPRPAPPSSAPKLTSIDPSVLLSFSEARASHAKSPILVENDSDDDEDRTRNHAHPHAHAHAHAHAQNHTHTHTHTHSHSHSHKHEHQQPPPALPVLSAEETGRVAEWLQAQDAATIGEMVTVGGLNLAHHLLAEIAPRPAKGVLVVLLGTSDEAAMALVALKHLLSCGRIAHAVSDVLLLYAVGGGGQKIELPPRHRALRRELAALNGSVCVQFIKSLADLYAVRTPALVIEALALSASKKEISAQAALGLGKWFDGLPATAALYSLGGSVYRLAASSALATLPVKLVHFSLPDQRINDLLPVLAAHRHSLLLVDAGIPARCLGAPEKAVEFFGSGFVVEIEL